MAQGTAEDDRAVRAVVTTIIHAWQSRDVDSMAAAYAPDADWTNAFGVQRHGRAQIRSFVERVFRNPQRAGVRQTVDSIVSVRFPAPTVAVVHEYGEQEGQQLSTGEPVGTRRTHWLLVLQKSEGSWLVASHLVMDEHTDPGDPLIRAEREFTRATQARDSAGLERVLAPEFVPASTTANVRTRAAWIHATVVANSPVSAPPRILGVRISGVAGEVDVALSPALPADSSATRGTAGSSAEIRALDVWALRDGRWQLVRRTPAAK
jgi:uncharacterized protein (TIGR02246 family)